MLLKFTFIIQLVEGLQKSSVAVMLQAGVVHWIYFMLSLISNYLQHIKVVGFFHTLIGEFRKFMFVSDTPINHVVPCIYCMFN